MKRVAIILALVGLAVMFLILNFNLEYITDDWHFKFVFEDFYPLNNNRRIYGLIDIVESMKNFYNISGGRVFAHSILQFILIFEKPVFNSLNTCVFVAISYLASCIVISNKENENKVNKYNNSLAIGRLSLTVVLIVLEMMLLPAFGETCLWVSGAVNYLWMSALPLMFFCFYINKHTVLSYICAFLSGFTNEATGGIIIVFVLLEKIIRHEKISKQNILQILLVIPGMLFVLLAPGNMKRAELIETTEVFSISKTFEILSRTIEWLASNGYLFFILPQFLLALIFRKKILKFADSLALLFASLAGMAALALSGTFIVRAQFLNVMLLIISLVSALLAFIKIIGEKSKTNEIAGLFKFVFKRERIIRSILILVFTAVSGVFISLNSIMFFECSEKMNNQIDTIEKSSENGENIMLKPVEIIYTGAFFPREYTRSIEYTAAWESEYYGVNIKYKNETDN